jgi:hypothetical protein
VKKTEQSSNQTASASVLFQVNFIELPFTFSCPYRYFERQGAEFSICSWRFCVAEFTLLRAIFDNDIVEKTCAARTFRADDQHRIDSQHVLFDKGQILKAVGMRSEMV